VGLNGTSHSAPQSEHCALFISLGPNGRLSPKPIFYIHLISDPVGLFGEEIISPSKPKDFFIAP